MHSFFMLGFLGIAKTEDLPALLFLEMWLPPGPGLEPICLVLGLHSYGFMDKAFDYLMMFIISQLFIIGLAYIPLLFGTSFSSQKKKNRNIDSLPDYNSLD
jgi:hypothetical protein